MLTDLPLGFLPGRLLSVAENPCSGMNNRTYILHTDRGDCLLRIPGEGAELFSDREGEAAAYRALSGLGLTDEALMLDADTGRKLSVYYPGSRTCRPDSPEDVSAALALLRRLHGLSVSLRPRPGLWERVNRFAAIAAGAGSGLREGAEYAGCLRRLSRFAGLLDCPRPVPVHGDALPGNFLFRKDAPPLLIDLEFTGPGDPLEDLAGFCHDAQYAPEDCAALLGNYLCREPSPEELRRLFAHCAAVALMWSGWAAFKAEREAERREFFAGYRDMSVRSAREALERVRE